jgi:hypothetical protein
LLTSFEYGGSILKIFYHHGDTMVFKTHHKWHPNHQLPLPQNAFTEDELWKLETERLTKFSSFELSAKKFTEELAFQLE